MAERHDGRLGMIGGSMSTKQSRVANLGALKKGVDIVLDGRLTVS